MISIVISWAGFSLMTNEFDANRKSRDKLAEYFGEFVEKANRSKAA